MQIVVDVGNTETVVGHATLAMTRRYTHFGTEAKREALRTLLREHPELASQA